MQSDTKETQEPQSKQITEAKAAEKITIRQEVKDVLRPNPKLLRKTVDVNNHQ